MIGLRKFAKEQPKRTDRVMPPSPGLAQLDDGTMSGFEPPADAPREIVIPVAARPPAPTVTAYAPVETARGVRPLPASTPAPAPVAAPAPAEDPHAEARALWEIYNRTENPADFVRADRAMRASGGETAQSRKRKTVQSLGKEEQPAASGEDWQRTLAYLKKYPIKPGEASAQAYNPSLRDMVGGAIAGEDPNTFVGDVRGRVADALTGSRGVGGSFGALDFVPGAGAALQTGDVGQAMQEGNYGTAAIMALLPGAVMARRPLMDAGRRAVEIARNNAPAIGAATAAGAAMAPTEADASFIGRLAKLTAQQKAGMTAAGDELVRRGNQISDPATRLGVYADIWNKHGWAPDRSGNWMSEIGDNTAALKPWGLHQLREGKEVTAGQLLEHPRLFNAYPTSFSAKVEPMRPGTRSSILGDSIVPTGQQGAFEPNVDRLGLNPAMNERKTLETILHELQHRHQQIEGHPFGTSPSAFPDTGMELLNARKQYEQMRDAYDLMQYARGTDLRPMDAQEKFAQETGRDLAKGWLRYYGNEDLPVQVNRQLEQVKALEAQPTAFEQYYRSLGEYNARQPGLRLGMPVEERRAAYPWAGQNRDPMMSPDEIIPSAPSSVKTQNLPNPAWEEYARDAGYTFAGGGLVRRILPKGVKIVTDEEKRAVRALGPRGNEIGYVALERYGDDATKQTPFNTAVKPNWQRKGIAAHMYDAAEHAFGPVSPSKTLSDDGFAFWKSYRPEAVQDRYRYYAEDFIGKPAETPYGPGVIESVGDSNMIARLENGNTARVDPELAKRLFEERAAQKAGGGLVRKALGKLMPEGSGYKPIEGKPAIVTLPDFGKVEARPIPALESAARSYMGGLDPTPERFVPINEDYARKVAEAFERMKHDPANPEVRRAYEALAEETLGQYRAAKDAGLDIRFLKPGQADPYARSPALGYEDIVNNGRLYVFPTEQGFGSTGGIVADNPLVKGAGRVGDKPDAVVNDAFRVVHDLYGHFGPGNPFFRAPGEERAFQLHSRMYSPEARGAMATETRGQNSWVNFGPHAEHNRVASGGDTIYADQKTGLLPDWATELPPEKAGGGAVRKAVDIASEAFRKWQGESKLPAERFYHGTSKDKDFAQFNVGRHGVWLTKDPAEASSYALENDSMGYRLAPGGGWNMERTNSASRVIPVYARAENPFTGQIPEEYLKENYKAAQSNWLDYLRAQGHDAWTPSENLAVILRDPQQIKSALTNTGDFSGPRIDKDKGGIIAKALKVARGYADPPTTKIQDWNWRPLPEVQNELGLTKIPPHVQQFGDYMREVSDKAGTEGLSAEDLIRAFTTTRASIQRGAVDADKVRAAGLPVEVEGKIRPEGAWSEWLMSPMGQRYVNEAAKGNIEGDAVAQAIRVMAPFGKHETDIPEAMKWAAQNLPGREGAASDLVARGAQMAFDPNEWREFTRDIRGIGPSKSGFVASLLGRGDMPTLDARQIILHTGEPSKAAGKYISRGQGLGGQEAVDRLASRQAEMALELPEQYKPFYQHLAHHAVWDKAGGDVTTHDDVMRAMRSGFDKGGAIRKAFEVLRGSRPANSPVTSQAGEHGFFVPETARQRDPRLYHPISENKLSRPLGEMSAEHQVLFAPPERKFIRPEDLEGAALILALGDRTIGGTLLRSVNETRLDKPVEMQAGHSFMYGPAAVGPDRAAWASDKGVITSLARKIQNAANKGYDPYLSYVPMSARAGDYSHHMADTLRELLAGAKVKNATIKDFDNKMRTVSNKDWDAYPDWPGIRSPKIEEYLYSGGPGKARTKMAQLMAGKDFQAAGMPDVGAARFAITDPELLHATDYSMGRTIAKVDPSGRVIDAPAVPHKTYRTQLGAAPEAGYVGGFKYDIPLEVANKEWVDDVLSNKPHMNQSQLAYTYRMSQPNLYMTPETVDRMSKYLEMKESGAIP